MTDSWIHKTAIYQIYPRSYFDSGADGIGDIKGIIQKLDHIHGLGFETIWVSPFFSSPQNDLGYDISNYTEIAPEYGTLPDVLRLIGEVHRLGMRIVFDLVMNHTSIEHEWFKESRSSRTNPRADWYLWRDKPNNWKNMTGGSGWHYDRTRAQYYWSSFLPFQPDLNYRNPAVKETMLDVVRFWLGKGVDGFRLDIFNVIYKDAGFRDNPFSLRLVPSEEDPSGFFQQPKYTMDQPESFTFADELKNVCNEFGEKLLLGEVQGGTPVINKYLAGNKEGLDLVFNFEMLNFKFTADFFRGLIEQLEVDFPAPCMPVYVFSNHDRRRSIHRLGEDPRKAKLLHLLQLTARGVPCVYYGEEIGMTDSKFAFGTALDPIPHKFKWVPRWVLDAIGLTINRDEVRTPMQWDATGNAGFSSAQKTWLPVHENHKALNVEAQNRDPNSLLTMIRRLMKIRNSEPSLHEGSLEMMTGLPGNLLGYKRKSAGKVISVIMNFGSQNAGFEVDGGNCIFTLSESDTLVNNRGFLSGFGGLILESV